MSDINVTIGESNIIIYDKAAEIGSNAPYFDLGELAEANYRVLMAAGIHADLANSVAEQIKSVVAAQTAGRYP